MAILNANDIKFFQSVEEGSAGGVISTLEIPKDKLSLIFEEVTREEQQYGSVTYRKVFALNLHPLDDLNVAEMWLLMQPCTGMEMALGIGTNNDTDGSLISYSSPISQDDAISLGDISPGNMRPIWIRRVVHAGTPNFETGFFQLALSGKVS